MQLESIGPGLKGVQTVVRLGPGIRIPTRSSLITLAGGEQLLLSPVAGLAAVREEIAATGPVVGLLAPNALHHLALEETQGLFPGAKIHAGVRVQRKHPELAFASTLGSGPSLWPELELVPLEGMPGLDEVAVLHRPSRSLLLCDVAFHFTPDQLDHTPSRWLLKLDGVVGGQLACSRLTRRFIRDPAALRRSIDRLLGLEFERVVPAHAAVLEHGARDALRAAFAFLPG
jgi:hypothetical protein